MQEFCILCGAKNIYESSRPRYCCSCGQAFNRTPDKPVESHSSSKPKKKSIFVNNDEEEEDEEDFSNLQLDKNTLAKDWSIEVVKPVYPTFEDLAIHSARPRGERHSRPEFKVDCDIIQASRQECAKVSASRDVTNNK